MKYLAMVIAIGSALFLSACTGKSGQTTFIHTIHSEYNTTETMKRFTKALSAKHYALTHTLDHTPLAAQEKMYLKPTISFELSQPMIDSKLLDCNPTLSTDLPVRIGVYRALSGAVTLVYTDPEYWSLKHNIKDKNCLELVKIMAADLDEATHAIIQPKK